MRGKSLTSKVFTAQWTVGYYGWGEGYMDACRGYREYIQLCRYRGIMNGWPLDVKENENWY